MKGTLANANSYSNEEKLKFSSENFLGTTAFEVFFVTLFVLECVSRRCVLTNKNGNNSSSSSSSSTTLSLSLVQREQSLYERTKDAQYVLLPMVMCLFNPRVSAFLGICSFVQRMVALMTTSVRTTAKEDADGDDDFNERKERKIEVEEEYDNSTRHFNLYRSTMLLAACSAILAIDFRQMPRRLGKTKEYGVSVMDVGVGSFVFSASVVKWKYLQSSKNGSDWFKRIKRRARRTFVSSFLGFARYVSVKRSGYQLIEDEYGPMWNFFFSMAVIDVLTSVISFFIALVSKDNKKKRMFFTLFIAFFIATIVEVVLKSRILFNEGANGEGSSRKNITKTVESWLLLPTKDRVFPESYASVLEFLALNREGAFSCVGMTSLHFYGRFFGEFIHNARQKGKLRSVLVVTILLWIATYTSIEIFHFKPSRRICNAMYILWMVTYNVSAMTVFAFVNENSNAMIPTILERANYQPMLVFLFANITTGIFNFALGDEIMNVNAFLAYALMLWHLSLIAIFINFNYVAASRSKLKQKQK